MTLLFKQIGETNKKALCVKRGSDRGIMQEVTMALLITCSFCPGESVLFETAPPPRDMRTCVHRHARMRACNCTRLPPRDMRGNARMRTCELRTDRVFLLFRRVRSLRNCAAAARGRNLPEAPKQPRMLPLPPLPCGGDGVQGPPAPAAAGWVVDA